MTITRKVLQGNLFKAYKIIDAVILSCAQKTTICSPLTLPSSHERNQKMAEGVLSDLARKVHEVLDSLILQKINLGSGVKAEFENLKSTVSTIQAVLPDAEKRSSHDQHVKGWLRDLRDVFLDADDLLDNFSTVALQYKMMTGNKMTKEVSIFFSSLKQLAFRLNMGQRTKAVRESLNVIVDDGKKFNLIGSPIDPQVMNRDMETYSFELKDVVGREGDKEKILKLLMDTDIVENVSIIPIVEIGGLGKTTLARDGPRILSWGGPEISEKKIQIRIHIVLINYQPKQIPKNHCFLIY